jgi:hypothetical protein
LECAAEEEKKADNFEQAEQIGQAPMSEAREKAESLFDKPKTDMEIQDPAPATNVEPITRAKRGGRKVAGGTAIE